MSENERRRAFVDHYLAIGTPTCGNATRSAAAAGYSTASARMQGSRLLKRAEVQAAIAARQAKRDEVADTSAERILTELAKIAFLDIADFFDEAGNILPILDMPAHARAAVIGFEVARANFDKTDGKRSDEWLHKFKLSPKVNALELLGKYRKMFVERVELEGDWDKLAARLAGARRRASGLKVVK